VVPVTGQTSELHRIAEETTVVISPLIALPQDQIDSAGSPESKPVGTPHGATETSG
jgi:hypothetical protein